MRRSFRLTRFVSNDVAVLASVPESERAESVVNLDLDELPVERALGVQWNVQEDVFSFRIVSRKKAPTRRGILSDISSMYDPLGFASPFILPAKRLLQHFCKDKVGWDEEISPNMLKTWERWLADLSHLQRISVPRYFKSHQLDEVKNTQLHHFSDASTEGYGAVSYLRFVDVNGDGKIQSSPNEADDNTKIGVNCSDSSREATLSNSRRARLENRCNYILNRFYLCSTVHKQRIWSVQDFRRQTNSRHPRQFKPIAVEICEH